MYWLQLNKIHQICYNPGIRGWLYISSGWKQVAFCVKLHHLLFAVADEFSWKDQLNGSFWRHVVYTEDVVYTLEIGNRCSGTGSIWDCFSVGAYEETHTREKRATHNSYDYYLIHTSAKWLKWKTGTIGLKLSKRRPRWEGCDSTDINRIVVHAMKLFHFLHSQKLSSWHHF